MEIRDNADGFALAFPQPGWVVLDAIRERAFTGAVVVGANPTMHVFADRGEIYWAQSAGAASIGARLVDIGALSAVELERGSVRVADVERLDRLFERTRVDPDVVRLAVRALADTAIADLARQVVAGVEVHPYRQHPSGVQHWCVDQPAVRPSAAPSTVPVDVEPDVPEPPAPRAESTVPDYDFSIAWNDGPRPPAAVIGDSIATAPVVTLTGVGPTDDFEVIWPTPAESGMAPASDRRWHDANPANLATSANLANLANPANVANPANAANPAHVASVTRPARATRVRLVEPVAEPAIAVAATDAELSASERLAVRRLVASVEPGLLDARLRLAGDRRAVASRLRRV